MRGIRNARSWPQVRLARWTPLLAAASLALGACGGTSNVDVESDFPTPLVSKLPVRMGVHLPEELRSFSHKEDIPRHSSWRFDLGAANVSLFEPLFVAMFDETVPVSTIPPGSAEAAGLHGIVKPQLERFEFDVPRGRNARFVEVWVQYRMELYTPEGGLVAEWPVTGYGKSSASDFGQSNSLRRATIRALREVGADLSIEFASNPDVSDWLKDIGNGSTDTSDNGVAVR